MKENSIKNERSSIEEDIIILEQLIIANENCIKNAKNKDNPFVTVWKKQNIAIEHILSDYKRVLKENEELKIKNNAIKRESEAYAEHMIRLDNELNLEKEKSKYEWIRQNCLSQELVNKLYIPIQKIKDNIEKEIKYHERNILEIENITMLKSKTAKEEAEIEFNKYAIVVLKKILHELIKEEEENYEENI